jgi:MoxR-like ATPase
MNEQTPEPPSTGAGFDFEARTDLSAFHEAVDRVKAEIGKRIVGQPRLIELMLTALLADGHLLIEGVPGVAKTLSAKLLARSLDLSFSRLQFTPDLMPSDVLGTSVFNAKTTDFEFRQGPIFAQLVLIDEINRAPAKTQAALFEVMEERQITIDGHTYPMRPPFLVMATQNPIEQEGTYRLPEAQLDRFLFKINVGYPKLEEEVEILSREQAQPASRNLSEIHPVLMAEEVQHYQKLTQQIRIESNLMRYIVEIVHATRNSREIYLGASPRASLNLLYTSRALAAIRGRDFVTPEDIQFLTGPVLQHRIMLTPEREMEGATPEEVVKRMVESVEVPR